MQTRAGLHGTFEAPMEHSELDDCGLISRADRHAITRARHERLPDRTLVRFARKIHERLRGIPLLVGAFGNARDGHAQKIGHALAVREEPRLQRSHRQAKGHPGRRPETQPRDEFRRAISILIEVAEHEPGTPLRCRVEAFQMRIERGLSTHVHELGNLDASVLGKLADDRLVGVALDDNAEAH